VGKFHLLKNFDFIFHLQGYPKKPYTAMKTIEKIIGKNRNHGTSKLLGKISQQQIKIRQKRRPLPATEHL